MEIWEIHLWEYHPKNEKGKDVIIITKEHDDVDVRIDGPARLQSIFSEHPEIEAVVDGMYISVPAEKTEEAVRLLGKHAITPEFINLEGLATRNQYQLVF
jgi:hypothetical protein